MENLEKIEKLEGYKANLLEWERNHDPKVRTYINQNTPWIREEVKKAGCFHTMTVAPPPIIGGMVVQIDPFDSIFNPPYLRSVVPYVIDFIDQTIGILRNPTPETFINSNETISGLSEIALKLIHPKIREVSLQKFKDGHFADAVETAFKAVNIRVKEHYKKVKGEEKDGASLMKSAFSPGNPVIVLDDLSTDSGKNIQQGYMEIFAGSMTGIRNPKAHEIVSIDSTRAIHFLFLASLEMNRLDDARIP